MTRFIASLIIFTSTIASAQITKEDMSDLLKPDRFTITFSYLDQTRDVEEYDDIWNSGNVDGEQTDSVFFAELGYRIVPGLKIKARAGKAQTDLKAFDRPSYNQSYTFNSFFGLGLTAVFHPFLNPELPVKLDFNLNETRSDTDESLTGWMNQWDISASIMKTFGDFYGEAGLRYVDSEIVYEHPRGNRIRQGGFEASNNIGLLFGAGYTFMDDLTLSLTLYCIESTGININLQYQF